MANEKALGKASYTVMTARGGEEAIVIACARIPDLILLDILLPKMGGLEVLQALRKNPLPGGKPGHRLEQSPAD